MTAVLIVAQGTAGAVGSGAWLGIFLFTVFFAWVVLLRGPISKTYEEDHADPKEDKACAKTPDEAPPNHRGNAFALWVPKKERDLGFGHVDGGIRVEKRQN